jgi:TATA-box binding protein (TBP) (component of TFIID and TFIIIB)
MDKREFTDIAISTRTIIVSTNVNINIENLFKNLPITEYTVVEKKRGRKKKNFIEQINNNVENGSIISIKYQGDLRGVDLKKRKKSKNKFFRNAVTIIISVNNKLINLKISANGKLQVTGCKNFDNCKNAVKFLLDILHKNKDVYFDKYEDKIRVIFNNVMTNKDFSMGITINRENLDNIINKETDYKSLYEISFGYTGVNLKMKLNKNIKRDFNCMELDLKTLEYRDYTMSYEEYVETLNEKELDKENKVKHVTFLVFQSGNVIMSGMNEIFMEKYYNIFYDIVQSNINKIEDKLVTC